jgi:hypothetical protein
MTSENHPAASIPTRLDASFQGVQVPPNTSVSPFSTLYPIPGLARPPLASIPNSTIPPSFFQDDYGAGGPSFTTDYQGQGTIFPPANVTPSMFDASFQEAFYPFAGMLPSVATADLLPSEDSGHYQQFSPPTFQWPLPMQQAQYQAPLEGVARMSMASGTQWPLPMQPATTASRQQVQYQAPLEGIAGMSMASGTQWPLPMQPAATASRQQAQYQAPLEGIAGMSMASGIQWPLPMQSATTASRQQAQHQPIEGIAGMSMASGTQWPLPMQPASTASRQQAQHQPLEGIAGMSTASGPMQPATTASRQKARHQAPLEGIAGMSMASATQWHAQDQVAQDLLVMQPSQEPGSVYAGNCQADATLHEAPSAPETSLQGGQVENQPSVELPAENTTWNSRQLEGASMNLVRLTV